MYILGRFSNQDSFEGPNSTLLCTLKLTSEITINTSPHFLGPVVSAIERFHCNCTHACCMLHNSFHNTHFSLTRLISCVTYIVLLGFYVLGECYAVKDAVEIESDYQYFPQKFVEWHFCTTSRKFLYSHLQ